MSAAVRLARSLPSTPWKQRTPLSPAKVDRGQIGFKEKSPYIGPAEVGAAQIGPTEIGVIKVCPTEICTAQIGSPEISPAKVDITEIGATQIAPTWT